MHNITQLLHLISISFAIGLAYIALDRFRCSKRVKYMLQGAIDQINQLSNIATNAANEDTAVTLLRRKLKDVSQNGLGVKFILNICPRMFGGGGDKAGWDVYLINFFIAVEYIFLVIGSLYPDQTNYWLYWGIVNFCVLGTLLPVIFIYSSTKIIKEIESYIEDVYGGLTEKGYDISISQLKDRLNGHI